MYRNETKLFIFKVYTAPEMEDRDPRVVIKEGESAAITCKARGKPPPTYTWIKASTREVRHNYIDVTVKVSVASAVRILTRPSVLEFGNNFKI